jgi:hypothetical protein
LYVEKKQVRLQTIAHGHGLFAVLTFTGDLQRGEGGGEFPDHLAGEWFIIHDQRAYTHDFSDS